MEHGIPRVWPKAVLCILSWTISIPLFWLGVLLTVLVVGAVPGVILCFGVCWMNARTMRSWAAASSKKRYLELIYNDDLADL